MKAVYLKAVCLIGLAGAVAVSTVMAAAPAATPNPTAEAAASNQLRVVRDRETGALRAPTAAELQEMNAAEAARPAPSAPLVVRQAANGTKTITLPKEYLIEVQARVDADGKVTTFHTDPAMAHNKAVTAVEK